MCYSIKGGGDFVKKMFGYVKKYFAATDRWMLLFCAVISLIGTAAQYTLVNSNLASTLNISNRIYIVHFGASMVGLLAAVIISNFDYHFLAKLWKLYIPVSVFLVLLTFVIGVQVDETVDDKAWLNLPFGLSFQPAELMKICFILSFAYHLSKVKPQLNSLLNVFLLALHGGAYVMLVHLQGDDGTAIVYIFIFIIMLFAAGLDWKYMVGGAVALAAASPLIWQYLLTEDQRGRILSVYFPEYAGTVVDDYQQTRGIISMGIGQLLGKGLFNEDYWYVPKMHNDFVFSFLGQALGFVGILFIVFLICGVCFCSVYNARNAIDPLGAYICYGFFAMFFFQSFVNIGMCIGFLPVIGITLPLISAGGTSIGITYLGIGLVLSVRVHCKRTLFFD